MRVENGLASDLPLGWETDRFSIIFVGLTSAVVGLLQYVFRDIRDIFNPNYQCFIIIHYNPDSSKMLSFVVFTSIIPVSFFNFVFGGEGGENL